MVDLTSNFIKKMWFGALTKCYANHDSLNDTEAGFVEQMMDEWQTNGEMFEPTTKQFNWLRQLAFDLDKQGL